MIQSVLKALNVLEAFTHEQHTLGVTELSKRLGYPKATVHNLLTTLKSRGYIEVDPGTSRYSLGLKILELSQAVRANIEIRDRATPFLRQLAQLSGETIYLTVLHDDHSVYIDSIQPSRRSVNHSDIGLRVPLHCTSVGKAKFEIL